MGLFDFNKPNWRHKNPAKRLEAIETIDPEDTEILVPICREDESQDVRRAAIKRLTDLSVLEELTRDAHPEDLDIIIARRETLFFDLIVDCQDEEQWLDNLNQIHSPQLLAELAVHGKAPLLRRAAVDRIDDQKLLTDILQQPCGKKTAIAALEKITDEALLADLARNAANKTARRQAKEKIAEIDRQKHPPSDAEITSRKLKTLLGEARHLKDSNDIDAAAQRLKAVKQEWQNLDSEYTHPLHGDFNRISSDFDDRYEEILARRRLSQEKSTLYEQFQTRLNELCSSIERVSCSTANDAEEAKNKAVEDWAAIVNDMDGEVVISKTVSKRFADACRTFDSNRKQIRREKESIKDFGNKCSEAQELITLGNLKQAAARLKEIQKSLAPIELKYYNKTLIEKLISDVTEDLTRAEKEVRDQNLASRLEICTELEALLQSGSPRYIEEQLQKLEYDWQQQPKPDGAKGRKLEQRIQKLHDAVAEKLQSLSREKDWELWANFNLKEQLTKTVTSLDREEDLETVINVIKQSQAEWKTIGPVPREKSQELWNEFQSACNRNFERAIPFLEEQKTKRSEAMDRRLEICKLAEELARSSDWKKTTSAFNELQEEWKTLLPGSRSKEQKLFKRFRKSCDHFFKRRQDFYTIQDQERQQNLLGKEKLCELAEEMAETPQADYAKKFKHLQSDWKKIGPVPRKNKEAVWKRFRKACDSFFDWLEGEQRQNLLHKEKLCEKVEKLVAEATAEGNSGEAASRLTELQEQWKDIGPVPRDQRDDLWKRFRTPIDQFFTARQKQIEKKKEQHQLNQSAKENLLSKAEELASMGQDKETTDQLKMLQQKWAETGSAPHGINSELNSRFQDLCDAFFEGRHQYFIDLKAEQLENQKKKESLCLRLENILGITYSSGKKEQGKVLSLAEELKQAMEDNFMLSGRRNEKKDISGEIHRIEQEWKKIGPAPHIQSKQLTERYQKALDTYYKNKRT